MRTHRIRVFSNGRFACDEHGCPGYGNHLHNGPTFNLEQMFSTLKAHIENYRRF